MQLVENLVCRSNWRQLSICDQEFTECEWIYQNSDEPLVDDEHEQLVDFERQTQKG